MLLQFNETIREAGLACNLNICNNEKLMQFISDRINDMPSLTTEEKSRYKSALDDLRHKAKTEDPIRLLTEVMTKFMNFRFKTINGYLNKNKNKAQRKFF